jgi:ATP-dependent DNA helicase RecG
MDTPDTLQELQERNYLALERPVSAVKGIGPGIQRHLTAMGIETVEGLIYHFPRRYLDRSQIVPIRQVRIGEDVTVVGTVRKVAERKTAQRQSLLQVSIYDGTAYLYGVWFNQSYHADRLKVGTEVAFSGKVQYRYNQLQITNPAYDVLNDPGEVGVDTVHTGRIIPLHPASQKLSTAVLRRLIKQALDTYGDLPDPLPARLTERYHVPSHAAALRQIHFPTGLPALKEARRRMIYEELFILQTGLAIRRKRVREESVSVPHAQPGPRVGEFIAALPYRLTGAQQRSFQEIAEDMQKTHPMNRLLQGEVGSGKTLVALLALLLTVENGLQGAFMVPTEVLAEQHYATLSRMAETLPWLRIALLTSSTPEAERRRILAAAGEGELDVLVGTHALIQRDVDFRTLGLVVIDEQHRFGVRQRVSLKEKGEHPHFLIMTATPIPRTLALTLYGDLEVSVLDEMPAGRAETVTRIFHPRERSEAYELAEREIEAGRQVFVVCPLVEDSQNLEAKAAQSEADNLRGVFPSRRIGLLHGQMKKAEKDQAMQDFRERRSDILVSTTVIEVGIDIPNATVMMVENADRFGLSQLHQLRGRVGRGSEKSYCLLFTEAENEEAQRRMEAMRDISDGFKLAEVDLELRGEGSLFSERQSGLPDLRLAKLSRDYPLLQKAREDAFKLVEEDPHLEAAEHRQLLREVRRRFSLHLEWLFHT